MTRNKQTLTLDKEHAKWLGVCAGVANFLDVRPWTVRLVFLGCICFGAWFLVPIYFLAWWLLEEDYSEVRNKLMDSQMVKHFRSVDYRKKLYRNTQEGKVWGVCAGIADYLEVSKFSVRIVFLLLTFMTFFPVLFYIGAMFVLEKRTPEEEYYQRASRVWEGEFDRDNGGRGEQAEQEGRGGDKPRKEQGNTTIGSQRKAPRDHYSKRREFQYCARKFATLQQRLVRIEAYVTSNRFKLNREFRKMS